MSNPFDLSETDSDSVEQSQGERGSRPQFLRIPQGEENAIVVKLVANPRLLVNGKATSVYSFMEHSHVAQIRGQTMNLNHPCRKTLGEESCPECDRFYELNDIIRGIRDQVKNAIPKGQRLAEDEYTRRSVTINPQYPSIKKEADRLRPREGYYVLVNRLDSDKIEALRLNRPAYNAIFKPIPATDKADEQPPLLERLKAQGYDPFRLRHFNDTTPDGKVRRPGGWLKIYSVGSVSSGNYAVRVEHHETLQEVSMPDGTKMMGKFPCATPVSPVLLSKTLQEKDFPDVKALAAAYAFAQEDHVRYVKTGELPSRRQSGEKPSEQVAPQAQAQAPVLTPAPQAQAPVSRAQVVNGSEDDLEGIF